MKTPVAAPRHVQIEVERRRLIPRPSMGTMMLVLLALKIGADVIRRRRDGHEPEAN